MLHLESPLQFWNSVPSAWALDWFLEGCTIFHELEKVQFSIREPSHIEKFHFQQKIFITDIRIVNNFGA